MKVAIFGGTFDAAQAEDRIRMLFLALGHGEVQLSHSDDLSVGFLLTVLISSLFIAGLRIRLYHFLYDCFYTKQRRYHLKILLQRNRVIDICRKQRYICI